LSLDESGSVLSGRSNPILVEIRRGEHGVSREARRRIREAAKRSSGAMRYEGNYLVVENNSLGLGVLGSIWKDLDDKKLPIAYWLETIPFDKLERRLKREDDLHRAAGIRRLGKNIKRRLGEVADLGPL
jgi:hypothetical protein